MDAGSEEWIGYALSEADRRRSMGKVLGYSCADAVPKGSNYTSVMQRVRVRYVSGQGEIRERSVIYKELPKNEHRRESLRSAGFYLREAKMYTEVLPELEKILRGPEGGGHEKLWPDCYGVRNRDKAYLLEDLKAAGFKMADRMKGLDFDHTALAIESLAKFHALTAVLIERGELNEGDFQGYWFAKSAEIANMVFKMNLTGLATSILSWQGEWAEYGEKLLKFTERFAEELAEGMKKDASKLRVLCHGDCWVNNFMFKYDRRQRPVQMKFLDFQLSFIGGPGPDLQYLLNTSLSPSLLLDPSDKKGQLLQVYHESLVGFLEDFGFKGERPGFQDVLDSYRSASIVGVLASLAFRPLMLVPEADTPDMDEIHEQLAQGKPMTLVAFNYTGEEYTSAIKYALKNAEKEGYFDKRS